MVGFAGLLDLGYVAFFAIGAHVAAYFGSAFWANAHFSRAESGAVADFAGIHLNFLLILVLAVIATTLAGVLIGVPTLRLRGDYVGDRHARVRRDHRRRSCPTAATSTSSAAR